MHRCSSSRSISIIYNRLCPSLFRSSSLPLFSLFSGPIRSSLFHSSSPSNAKVIFVDPSSQASSIPSFVSSSSPPPPSSSSSSPSLSPGSELDSFYTPEEIVIELDKNVIGQADAKKAVAMALRNRLRRKQLDKKMKEEVKPHNILMIGPTGSGKTEIARRLARLAHAPFLKTEMTKYTEVGIYGSDVDSIIKDLVDSAIRLEREKAKKNVSIEALKLAEEKMASRLQTESPKEVFNKSREEILELLRAGKLNHIILKTNMSDDQAAQSVGDFNINADNPNKLLQNLMKSFASKKGPMAMALPIFDGPGAGGLNLPRPNKKRKERTITVAELLSIYTEDEASKLVDNDDIIRLALKNTEESGIVVLDEIDKLANGTEMKNHGKKGEGVQKELLSLIEGTDVETSHGIVKTDHILFIASGAFYKSKPSDLLPELQGRLPIRVQLSDLTEKDFLKILTETEYNLIDQQIALMKTEGIELIITKDAAEEIAKVTAMLNSRVENIGARRLNTIISRVMSDISYYAPNRYKTAKAEGKEYHQELIDAKYVRDKVAPIVQTTDLSKFIL